MLQVGVILDGLISPAWIKALLTRLKDSEHIALNQVFLTGDKHRRTTLFFWLYSAIDRALFPIKDAALAPVAITDTLVDIPNIEIRGPADWIYNRSSLTHLDVLLDLGSGALPGELSAPCALWHFGIPMRQGLAGLAEVVQRREITCAELFAEMDGTSFCIYRSYSGTHKLSARRNRQRLFWKAHAFIAQRLEQLAQSRPEVFYKQHAIEADPTPPNHRHLWRHLPTFKWFWWRQALSDLFYRTTWHVHCGPSTDLPNSFTELKEVAPTPTTYWADPFLFEHGQERLLFVEEYDLKKKKGHIAVASLHADAKTSPATKIIDEPYHLSYPFIFSYQNEIYMLPESGDNATIDLYRCVEFPHQWQRIETLMRGVYAVDSTLFAHDNRWWLFTCLSAHPEAPARDELFLFYADSPLSTTWTPHPLNPIVSDVRNGRPAGRIFLRDGHIYRPTQDCSRRYGYALRIMEITRLDEVGYEEREYRAYLPQGKRVGIHTYNNQAGWTAVDIKTRSRRWP